MADDPLSQILDLIDARAVTSIGLEASGRWAVHVPPTHALKCNMIKHGSCIVQLEGGQWKLEAGDCFLVGPDRPFVIGTDMACSPRPAAEVFAGVVANGRAQLNAGPGQPFLCQSGRMELSDDAGFLTGVLPAAIIVRSDDAVAQRINWLIDRLEQESGVGAPGAVAMISQIMQMIFIELIRTMPDRPTGNWVAALSDPRIGVALRAVHRDPGRDWRLGDMAAISHLSRSRFSARFRTAVGQAPMDYVLRLRMALARKALAQPTATIAAVAARFGYSSESAFIHAFRRTNGTTPRRFRRNARRQEASQT